MAFRNSGLRKNAAAALYVGARPEEAGRSPQSAKCHSTRQSSSSTSLRARSTSPEMSFLARHAGDAPASLVAVHDHDPASICGGGRSHVYGRDCLAVGGPALVTTTVEAPSSERAKSSDDI